MILFRKLQKLFPRTIYRLGVLTREETLAIAPLPLHYYYHAKGTLLYTSKTKRLWQTIQSSLVILQYSPVAYDYRIKPETQKLLKPFRNECVLLTIDLKAAALKAGLGSRAYNTLVWNSSFGFDFKIAAWGFFDTIVGYHKQSVPLWLKQCNGCLLCHAHCPAHALSGSCIDNFKFRGQACSHIIDKPVLSLLDKRDAHILAWEGVKGGLKNHCRVCQEQAPCTVIKRKMRHRYSRRKKRSRAT